MRFEICRIFGARWTRQIQKVKTLAAKLLKNFAELYGKINHA
jgi:hypothetical protein